MHWKEMPIISEPGMASAHTMRIYSGSHGMLGSHITRPEYQLERDLNKRFAGDIAVILETNDGWKSYSISYEGKGRIVGSLQTSMSTWLIHNKRVSAGDWKETNHILARIENNWIEISEIPLQAVTIRESGGPWLLAIGRTEKGGDSVSVVASSDGGRSWQLKKADERTSIGITRGSLLNLKPNGVLYMADSTSLSRIDLNSSLPTFAKEVVAEFPGNFRPVAIAGDTQSVTVLGVLPDNSYAIWKWNMVGSNQTENCRNVPSGFTPKQLVVCGPNLYVTGLVEQFSNGATSGYHNHILQSRDGGLTWTDLHWPIKGSLNAIDFGDDGSIWGVAAGNRIRTYTTARKEPL